MVGNITGESINIIAAKNTILTKSASIFLPIQSCPPERTVVLASHSSPLGAMSRWKLNVTDLKTHLPYYQFLARTPLASALCVIWDSLQQRGAYRQINTLPQTLQSPGCRAGLVFLWRLLGRKLWVLRPHPQSLNERVSLEETDTTTWATGSGLSPSRPSITQSISVLHQWAVHHLHRGFPHGYCENEGLQMVYDGHRASPLLSHQCGGFHKSFTGKEVLFVAPEIGVHLPFFPQMEMACSRIPPASMEPTLSFNPSEAGSLEDTDWCPSPYQDQGQGPSRFPRSHLPLWW